MQLTAEQVRSIRAGKAIRVDDSEVGETCIVVLANVVPMEWQDDGVALPMEVVSRLVDDAMKEYDDEPLTNLEVGDLIERTMKEYDADDPGLAIYQEMVK